MSRKTYFLSPSWGLGPDEIVLGSVIPNLSSPHKPISSNNLPSSIDSTIFNGTERLCSGTAKSSKEWGIGLFSSFIHLITLGGEMSYSSSSATEVKYSAEIMETKRFSPSSWYIQKAVDDGTVKSHLKMGGMGAKVFLVTGIKIVQGVTITNREEKENETNFRIGVEIPVAQLTVGPKVQYRPTTSQTHSSTVAGPIVFAFEVEKLQVNRRGKGFSKEHVKGAMLGQQDDIEDVVEAAGNKLDEDELDDLGLEAVSGLEDETGDECLVVFPSTLDNDSDDNDE
jgi:hypothetical protein